jgi:metal-dependent amidase/aminoacylase/carboxypeptidase family protein
MERRFAKMAEAAAFMSGARLELARGDDAYGASLFNKTLNAEYLKTGPALGLSVEDARPYTGRISSDFGDVSRRMPGANLNFGIIERWTREVPLHSEEFREAAATPFAFEQAMKVAATMAAIGTRYVAEPEFKSSVDAAFRAERSSRSE